MRYRLTCLTPLLVGDGQRLSPIDYMVWKDHVNVLDQKRIFRLLSRGPRLEGYLAQLKRADKLDFASWGGFAQNFAGRRIPFEDASLTAHWERARADSLHIPTFASGPAGPYLPASALKGALRTGVVAGRLSSNALKDAAARLQGDRPPRRVSEAPEEQAVGHPGSCRMKAIGASDSAPVPVSAFKIYLLRVATLQARGAGRYELGWKTAARGTVDGRRPEDSTPVFAEMAAPGAVFEGRWEERLFFSQPDILRALNWREFPGRERVFESANQFAAGLLDLHKKFAETAGLAALARSIEQLEARLAEVRQSGGACLLPLGWGSGFLAKVASLDTSGDSYRQVLRQIPLYSRAIQTGLPFPKTRRVIWLQNQPAALPGWVILEVAG